MKKLVQSIGDKRLVTRACVMIFACVIASPLAVAQATRTWVSGVGDDANPGSRTAPCKTFAGAIGKTAIAGEIDAMDPGGFGTVTITKSITIDGGATFASILGSGTNGVVINAGAASVVNLRNLSINGASTGLTGIRIISAAEVNIENCVIFQFNTRGIEIQVPSACRVNIRNTIIRDCSGGALLAHPNSVLTLSKCSLLSSQFGFRAEGAVTANFDDCVVSGHAFHGVIVDTTSVVGQAIVSLDGCVVTDNSNTGVASKGEGSSVRISNNTIANNIKGISNQSGGVLLSFGNNRIFANTTNGSPSGEGLLK